MHMPWTLITGLPYLNANAAGGSCKQNAYGSASLTARRWRGAKTKRVEGIAFGSGAGAGWGEPTGEHRFAAVHLNRCGSNCAAHEGLDRPVHVHVDMARRNEAEEYFQHVKAHRKRCSRNQYFR